MTDQCKHCEYRGELKNCRAADCFHHESWYAQQQQRALDELKKLRPMSEAPRYIELLGYHAEGKNLHQVKWSEYRKCWTMRWCTEYRCQDGHYVGWLPMPEVEIQQGIGFRNGKRGLR